MRVVIDIEANGLETPDQIWLIVCKDIDTNQFYIFRNITTNEFEKNKFIDFSRDVTHWVGHNLLAYDLRILHNLCGISVNVEDVRDTLILSKLVDYSRVGHSIEDYGIEFGLPKGKFTDFSKYSLEMEEYCIRDVEITHKVYLKYLSILEDPKWASSILLEHRFQLVVNDLETNGFSFNITKANKLLTKVEEELIVLDDEILKAFPPREVLIREFTPKATKHGTINRSSVPRLLHARLHEFEIGQTYRHTREEPFNPSSHKQIVQVLRDAGWAPIDRTQTHIDTDRELNRLRYSREPVDEQEVINLKNKLEILKKTGWKVNENNLNTLPAKAPAPARLLAKRILLESRRRTLTEWLSLVRDDGRIHGHFYGIGAWTHRMAHQHPNTANIPTDAKLYGGEMRSLWQAPRKRLLVGVDAEGIQLRVFAHYIDDKEFTDALVRGRKDNKTDPHSLNQRILGSVCKSRQISKRFVYALLLGAGLGKLTQILECSESETKEALDRLLARYTGFARLKNNVIPKDANRGYFIGLDGRQVAIPGSSAGERKHLCMSGYLQNGEAIIMKKACLLWASKLKEYEALLVNFVHDEWQIECPNDMTIAEQIAKMVADSLRITGETLKLKCPLAGSYYNDDLKDYTIGVNWKVTH